MFGGLVKTLLQPARTVISTQLLPLTRMPLVVFTRGRAYLGGRTVVAPKGSGFEAMLGKLKKITISEGLVKEWKDTRHTRRGQAQRLQVKDNIRRKMKDEMRQKISNILATKNTGIPSIGWILWCPLSLTRSPSLWGG